MDAFLKGGAFYIYVILEGALFGGFLEVGRFLQEIWHACIVYIVLF